MEVKGVVRFGGVRRHRNRYEKQQELDLSGKNVGRLNTMNHGPEEG